MRRRRRVKKRFFVIIAFLVLILCITMAKILQGNPGDIINIPVLQQQDISLDPFSDGELVVCLDAGHGGYDVGAESVLGFYEKDINLKVVLKIGELLEKKAFKVIYTRKTDEAKGENKDEDLRERCRISNEANADIFISVHCNFDKHSSSKGLEVWCRRTNEKGEELAKCLDKQLSDLRYTRDRGLKYETERSLFVLQNTIAPAALVELGFLSNAEDSAYIKSDAGHLKCADAIAKAIEVYFNQTDIKQIVESDEN